MSLFLRAARGAVSALIILCFGAGVASEWAAIRLRALQQSLTDRIEGRADLK